MASLAYSFWSDPAPGNVALDPVSADIGRERRLLVDVRQQLGCGSDTEPRVLALVRGNGGLGRHFIPDTCVFVMDGRIRARLAFSAMSALNSILLCLILFF